MSFRITFGKGMMDNGRPRPNPEYHLTSIGLQERCHKDKRAARKKITLQILNLCKKALFYESHNPAELHIQTVEIIRGSLELLDKFPPLVTNNGVVTARNWLQSQGVDMEMFKPRKSV